MELPVEILPGKTLTAQEIHDQLHGEMKNASYDAATGAIIPEQVGADFDRGRRSERYGRLPPPARR